MQPKARVVATGHQHVCKLDVDVQQTCEAAQLAEDDGVEAAERWDMLRLQPACAKKSNGDEKRRVCGESVQRDKDRLD